MDTEEVERQGGCREIFLNLKHGAPRDLTQIRDSRHVHRIVKSSVIGKVQWWTHDTHSEQTDTPPTYTRAFVCGLIVENDCESPTVRGVLSEGMFQAVDQSRLGAEWMLLLWLKDVRGWVLLKFACVLLCGPSVFLVSFWTSKWMS